MFTHAIIAHLQNAGTGATATSTQRMLGCLTQAPKKTCVESNLTDSAQLKKNTRWIIDEIHKKGCALQHKLASAAQTANLMI
jgi:hypothetical protein